MPPGRRATDRSVWSSGASLWVGLARIDDPAPEVGPHLPNPPGRGGASRPEPMKCVRRVRSDSCHFVDCATAKDLIS